jgi:PhnB protein
MKTKAIPEDFHSLTPDLVVSDVVEAIEFYKRAFGATKRRVFHGPEESIVHAEIQIGDSILMLSPEFPEMNVLAPQSQGGCTSASLYLYVEDVDAVYAKAVSAGAKVTGMPLADAFWGDRAGSLVDPFGHRWMLATHIKDLSNEDIEMAGKAMFAKKH